MWPNCCVLITINTIILLVHSLPPNIDWNTLRNDPDPVSQNEKILNFFLQLAVHAADYLIYLRNKTSKECDYNKTKNNSSEIETFITQSPFLPDLESIDKNQNIFNYSSFDNLEINTDQNQTSNSQQLFDTNFQNTDNTSNLNLKESFEISPRLFDSDLAQVVPKIINDTHENVTQYILPQNAQHTQELSDKINMSQKLFNPVIIKKNEEANLQTADSLSITEQISSSTKNVTESMTEILPKTAKNVSLFNQIIPQSQEAFNKSLKVDKESRNYLHSNHIQQEQDTIIKQGENQLHNQDSISNVESNKTINASERNNEKTALNNFPINNDNYTAENNKQHTLLLKESSVPLFRLFSNFDERENNVSKEIEITSSFTEIDDNNFTDEQQTIKNYTETYQDVNQIDKEGEAEGSKEINETRTDHKDEQLNSITEDLSTKYKKSTMTDITSPNPLDSSTIALGIITEHEISSSINPENMISTVTKSNLEEENISQNNSFIDEIDQSINQIIRVNILESIDSHPDKGENLHEQLSEAKLQEISDRLISALWLIIEKRVDNNSNSTTNYYDKQKNNNLPSNMLSNSTQAIYKEDFNHAKTQSYMENAISNFKNEDYN